MRVLKYVPGFRSGKTWKQIIAILFYIIVVIIGFAGGVGGFLLMLGLFFLVCAIVDLILHGLRKREDISIKHTVILLLVALVLVGTGGALLPSDDAVTNSEGTDVSDEKVAEAEALYSKAEKYIGEGKIDKALEVLNDSKKLNPDKNENKAFDLAEKIQRFNSEDFLKETLINISDDDFDLLVKGELKAQFIEHKKLNSMFLDRLAENADKRSSYIAEEVELKRLEKEKAEKRRLAEKAEARKEMIEKQFSGWDGSHVGLTEFIKSDMHDPKSYKHVETVYWDMKDHLVVQTTFRGTNAFGGVVKSTLKAKVSLDGDVLEIIDVF